MTAGLTVATHGRKYVCHPWKSCLLFVYKSPTSNDMYVSRTSLRKTLKATRLIAHFILALGARRNLTHWPN